MGYKQPLSLALPIPLPLVFQPNHYFPTFPSHPNKQLIHYPSILHFITIISTAFHFSIRLRPEQITYLLQSSVMVSHLTQLLFLIGLFNDAFPDLLIIFFFVEVFFRLLAIIA